MTANDGGWEIDTHWSTNRARTRFSSRCRDWPSRALLAQGADHGRAGPSAGGRFRHGGPQPRGQARRHVPVTIKATDDYGVASHRAADRAERRSLAHARDQDVDLSRAARRKGAGAGDLHHRARSRRLHARLDLSAHGAGDAISAPRDQKTTSRPIILRVAGLRRHGGAAGRRAREALRVCSRTRSSQQTQANGLTDNLALHLAEALAADDVPKHLDVMTSSQTEAQDAGESALDEAGKHDEGKIYLAQLQPLVQGEMGLALGQIGAVCAGDDAMRCRPGSRRCKSGRSIFSTG